MPEPWEAYQTSPAQDDEEPWVKYGGPSQIPGQQILQGTKTPPDQAAKVIDISNRSGVPAPVVNLNPEKHQRDLDVVQGTDVAERNPHIQRYLQNSALAAAVSAGDFPALDTLSRHLQALAPDKLERKSQVGLLQGIPEMVGMLGNDVGRQRLWNALKQVPAALAGQALDFVTLPGKVAGGEVDLNTPEGMDAAIGEGIGIAMFGAGRFGKGTKIGPDIRLGRTAEGPAKVSTPAEIESFLSRIRGFKTRDEIDEFLRSKTAEVPPQVALPVRAQVAADSVKGAIDAAGATKTAERSTSSLEDFADAHPNHGTVHIPGQKILEIYQAEGKIPSRGDGLLGFIPDLAKKATLAAETGTEISVPMNRYIVGMADRPELHEKIADVVRAQPKGVTLEEAKEAKPEEASQGPPPPAPGTVRFYHGGHDPTSGGGRWVTPNYDYARRYRAFEEDNPVHYVDIPKGDPVEVAARDWDEVDEQAGTTAVGRYHSLEVPEEWAKQLKPFELKPEEPLPKDPVAAAVVKSTRNESRSLGMTKPLFTDEFIKDAEAVGITKPELTKYADLIDRANENVLTKAVNLAAREVKRRQGPEWARNRELMAAEVESDLRSRPDLAAERFIREGVLPTGERQPPIKLEDADTGLLARTFGFGSGPELLRALDRLKEQRKAIDKGPKAYFNQLVKEETERRMEVRYGKLADNIAIEASEIALNEHNVDLLSAEWRMLAKLAGQEGPVGRSDLTAWTKDQFRTGRVSYVDYETWRRTAEKMGREAEKALLAGKYEDALKAKQTQMVNVLLGKEAKTFEAEKGKFENLLGKYEGKDNLPAVEQVFTDQIHGLMQAYGVETRRTRENVDYNLAGKDWATFVDEQNRQRPGIPKPVLPRPGTDLGEFTVDQYRDFNSLLTALDTAGRDAKKIEIAGKKEDYFQAIDQITKSLDGLEKKKFDPDAKGAVGGLRRAGRYVDAKLLKAERLLDFIDREDPLGPLNGAVIRPLIEGEQNKGFMHARMAKMVKDLPADRAWGKNLNVATDNQELRDWETGELRQITNEQKVVIALNYGNMGNRDVMLKGHHWAGQEVESFLKRTMTKMDWDMVNAIHSLFEPLGPLVEEVTRKRSGKAIPLVEPSPFLESKGGYFPLIQDPRDVLIGTKQQVDLFAKTKFNPLPMSQALKERTGAVYRLDFSLERLNSIISQTIHAVYLQDPVINANKVLKDPMVREGVTKGFGPEYVRLLDDWIDDIANNGGQNDDSTASWISRNLRENVVTAVMGYKASTAMIHGVSAASASLFEIGKMHLREEGPKSFVLAPIELAKNIRELGLDQVLPEVARRFFANPNNTLSTYQEVMSRSRELPNRQRNLNKDFGYQLDKIVNKTVWDDAARLRAIHNSYAMALVSWVDLLTATPVFKAAEAKALLEGKDPEDAIYIGDKAVREAHGSASLISRANVGRGEIGKWATFAYNGYWNHNYNKSRQIYRDLGPAPPPPRSPQPGLGAPDRPMGEGPEGFTAGMKLALGAAYFTAMFVVPAIIHHAIRGEEEDDPKKMVASMLASQASGQVPLVNSMLWAIIHERDPQLSPLDPVLANLIGRQGLARDVVRSASGEEARNMDVHALRAMGTLGFGPTNQIIDAIKTMEDIVNDNNVPESVGDWTREIVNRSGRQRSLR